MDPTRVSTCCNELPVGSVASYGIGRVDGRALVPPAICVSEQPVLFHTGNIPHTELRGVGR